MTYYYLATLAENADDEFTPPEGVSVDRSYGRFGILKLASERPLHLTDLDGVIALEAKQDYRAAEEE